MSGHTMMTKEGVRSEGLADSTAPQPAVFKCKWARVTVVHCSQASCGGSAMAALAAAKSVSYTTEPYLHTSTPPPPQNTRTYTNAPPTPTLNACRSGMSSSGSKPSLLMASLSAGSPPQSFTRPKRRASQ